MLKNDYVMRMIAELGQAMLKVAGLRKDNKHEQALIMSRNCYQDLLGLPADLSNSLPPEVLVQSLGNLDKLRILATLLDLEAGLLAESGELDRASRLRTRAEIILLEGQIQLGVGDEEYRALLEQLQA